MSAVRAIRGAIDVPENSEGAILTAATRLLEEIIRRNCLCKEDVCAVVFSATADLNAVYPARAARTLGWTDIALMCMQEMEVPGSMPFCLRVLVLWNTDLTQEQVQHVYLGAARQLRPDLVEE